MVDVDATLTQAHTARHTRAGMSGRCFITER
jgi:hypothetical protein